MSWNFVGHICRALLPVTKRGKLKSDVLYSVHSAIKCHINTAGCPRSTIPASELSQRSINILNIAFVDGQEHQRPILHCSYCESAFIAMVQLMEDAENFKGGEAPTARKKINRQEYR